MKASGFVVGLDVGYSPTARTSAICGLGWSKREVSWVFRRFPYRERDCVEAIQSVVGNKRVDAVALDGPLRRGFDPIEIYRAAERSLTVRSIRERIGKPGQASSGNGKRLNLATNFYASLLRRSATISHALHAVAIDSLAIVEAFPTTFLGLLLNEPARFTRPSKLARSDAHYVQAQGDGALDALLKSLSLSRPAAYEWRGVTNHDERAALACALTALCVVAGQYTAVGDDNGWIVLPPSSNIAPWALPHLREQGDVFFETS